MWLLCRALSSQRSFDVRGIRRSRWGLIAYSTVRLLERGSLTSMPREIASVFLLSSAILFLLAYPLTIHPGSEVFPQGGDTNLFLWILGWDVHAIVHDPLSIF